MQQSAAVGVGAFAEVDDGRIAEHRTQESLMERDGIYARLFPMPAEGYRVGPEPRVEVCEA